MISFEERFNELPEDIKEFIYSKIEYEPTKQIIIDKKNTFIIPIIKIFTNTKKDKINNGRYHYSYNQKIKMNRNYKIKM